MRQTPFDLVFGGIAEERFPRLTASLETAGIDPHDLDAFVLDREVTELLRELVPDEAGEALGQHITLLHHAYLYWREGGWLFRVTKSRTDALLSSEATAQDSSPAGVPRAYYIQFPERRIWAELEPGQPHEPLDGMFVRPWPGGGYFVLGIFGMHASREGFTVADADGFPTGELAREDGSPLFSPVLPGGAPAGLSSLVGSEEILELAARTVASAAEAVACEGAAHRPHSPTEIP